MLAQGDHQLKRKKPLHRFGSYNDMMGAAQPQAAAMTMLDQESVSPLNEAPMNDMGSEELKE